MLQTSLVPARLATESRRRSAVSEEHQRTAGCRSEQPLRRLIDGQGGGGRSGIVPERAKQEAGIAPSGEEARGPAVAYLCAGVESA